MSKVKPAPLPPDTTIGGYRIIRKVAAGGFGLVYLALDADGQQVAVNDAAAFTALVEISKANQPAREPAKADA